jgi:Pectate lyase superfamily protein
MFTRLNYVDYTAPAVTADWLNGMQTKIDEQVSLKDFNVVGDGVTDDTTAVQAFFTYLATNGGVGFIPVGTYKITASIALVNPTNGFIIRGAGNESVLALRAGTGITAISIQYPHDMLLENFKIDCGYSVTGFASHGISMLNAQNVTIRDIEVNDHRNSAMLAFVDTQFTYGNTHFINCVSQSNAHGQNGFLLEGMSFSSIQNCRVYPLDPAGSPCYGLQLKNKCRNSYILGGIAQGCKAGIALASDATGTGEGPTDCYARGVLTKDCWDGAVLGKGEDCFVQYHADMANSPAPSGLSGYALNVAGFNANIIAEVTITGVQSGRTCIRVRSDDAAIYVPYVNGYGSKIIEMDSGVNRTMLTVGDLFPASTNIYDLITDNSGQTDNRVTYLRDTTSLGLTNSNFVNLRLPGKAFNYMSYSGASDTFAWRANGTDILSASASALSPQPDITVGCGTSGRRWTGVWSQKLALVDGVTAPAAVSGHAQIYVDSADGDLKIIYANGVIKTIVVDT